MSRQPWSGRMWRSGALMGRRYERSPGLVRTAGWPSWRWLCVSPRWLRETPTESVLSDQREGASGELFEDSRATVERRQIPGLVCPAAECPDVVALPLDRAACRPGPWAVHRRQSVDGGGAELGHGS